MGFVYVNATRPAVVFVRSLLREKLRQLQLSSVRYYNDQRHMNQVLVEVSALRVQNGGCAGSWGFSCVSVDVVIAGPCTMSHSLAP